MHVVILKAVAVLADGSGKVLATGAERSFFFSAGAQRICLFQIAYEAKNFCDSVIHNDGVLFLLHHTATAMLSVSPLQHYALPN